MSEINDSAKRWFLMLSCLEVERAAWMPYRKRLLNKQEDLERLVHHRIRQTVSRARVAASKRLALAYAYAGTARNTKRWNRQRIPISLYLQEVQALRVISKQLDLVLRSFNPAPWELAAQRVEKITRS